MFSILNTGVKYLFENVLKISKPGSVLELPRDVTIRIKNALRRSHAGTPEGKLVVFHPARRSDLLAGRVECGTDYFNQLAGAPFTG
jgi:hypothetical protein